MAISQMKKLSIILPKESVDRLLVALQGFSKVQIHDLHQESAWLEAFEQDWISLPEEADQALSHAEKRQKLLQRQEELERLIQSLEGHIPRKGMLEGLKEKPRELFFESLEQVGSARDEEALLTKVQKQLSVLEKAQDQLEKAQAEFIALEKWAALEVTPYHLKGFQHIHAVIGTIPNDDDDQLIKELRSYPQLEVQDVFTRETEHGVIIYYQPGSYSEVQQILESHQFKAFEYEDSLLPAERLEALQGQIKEQEAVIAATEATLAASSEALDQLKVQLDYVLNLYTRHTSKESLASTEYLVAMEGWIEEDQVETLRSFLLETFDNQFLLEVQNVTEEDWERVPIKLKNHSLVEPFELVTEMYALPKYYEKDPTPILSLFYFVFFGMMVADIGYGLLLFGATSFALRAFHLKSSAVKNLRFFRLLGIAVALWGVVYGSFFGFDMPFALIRTTTNAMTILILSVVFGFITVLVGLFLGGMQRVRMKDYTDAYNSGFAWVLILFGLMLLAVGNLLPGFAFLVPIGQWLAIINAIGILIVSVVSAKKLTGLAAGLFNLYNVSGYVGDLVSFTRLMALGLSGASIGSAFNLIVNLFPPLGRFTIGILLFVLLHAINMFLSFLSGYVHGARLIFVEFFGKFYEGGGKPFEPLKPAERYIKNKMK